jgi:hypothetical protein
MIVKHISKFVVVCAAFTCIAIGSANAQIIQFDIQGGSNTATGFTGVGSYPASDGTVSLNVNTGPSGTRDRGVTTPITGNPDADILRDLHFWSTSDPIVFTFSGLAANTEYNALAWVFDSESGNSGKNIDFTTAGGSGGGTISLTTDNTDASGSPYTLTSFFSTAGGTATITMDHTGGAGGAVSFVNGFELSVVPEPSSATLLLLGLGSLFALRRMAK